MVSNITLNLNESVYWMHSQAESNQVSAVLKAKIDIKKEFKENSMVYKK